MQKTINGYTTEAQIKGLRVAVDTFDEGRKVGTVERLEGLRAIVRFDDGRWAYSNSILRIV